MRVIFVKTKFSIEKNFYRKKTKQNVPLPTTKKSLKEIKFLEYSNDNVPRKVVA